MATTWEIIDESETRVITLEWGDLHTLPDFGRGLPRGARSRPMKAVDDAIDFFAELRELNRHHLSNA